MGTNWQIGDRIENRWEIHKILRGGLGVVYVVYDHEWNVPFAAKTFQEEVFSRNPAIGELFTREALAWVKLDVHRNITQARLVQQIEGKPFLFLEFVSGGDLGGWIGTPRLTEDLEQVLRFATGCCDGMIHAKSKGIKVHRDIKPQNCLITQDGTLKVTDFGLAKVFDDALIDDRERQTGNVGKLGLAMSRTGTAAGTPPYMAPEQFEDAKHVDVRADIYAFGVMVFQMLTGRLPFVGRSWEELKRQHNQEPPRRLEGQPRVIDEIVQKCLAKAPGARWGDFAQLRERLGAAYEQLTGRATAPPPATGAELGFVQWANKGVSLAALGRHEEALVCYDRALEISPREAQAWSNKGVELAALGRREEALVCYDRALQINPRYADAWSNKGSSLLELGRSEKALVGYERALEINPQFAEAWSSKGNALKHLGRREEALVCHERALEINPRYAGAWINKGAWLAEEGREKESLACYDEALEISPGYAEAWSGKGLTLAALGRHGEALVCYNRALEISPRYADACSNKGVALAALGRHEEALVCYGRALEINPRDARTWYNEGNSLAGLGRQEEALVCYDRALEIDPQLEGAWNNKGISLAALRRPGEAIVCYDRALEINPREANAWFSKGAALGNSREFEKALVCFEEARKLGQPRAQQAIAQCRQRLGQ